MRLSNSTTLLPRVLLDQISDLPGTRSARKHRSQPSRRELRKQARGNAKQRKSNFFSAPVARQTSAKGKRLFEDEGDHGPPQKKRKLLDNLVTSVPTSVSPGVVPQQFSELSMKYLVASAASSQPRPRPKSPKGRGDEPRPKKAAVPKLPTRTPREKDEDAYIARLEAKLRKGKGKHEDGLDDLMELVSGFGVAEVEAKDVSEEESFAGSDGNLDDSEEWQGCQISLPERNEPSTDDVVAPDAESIPPHLRKASPPSQKSESQVKLTRQLKGLLNRMSEGNIGSIVDSVEDSYRSNARHDVTSVLATLLVDTIALPTTHLESYVLLHATFVAALGRVGFGGDFVPSFIQKVVETYEDQRCHSAGPGSSSTDIDASAQGDEISTTGGKQAANLLLLLTSMYNLQLISCVLVFDLVRELIQGRDETPEQQMLKEEDVELILIIARYSGPQLRSDDPTALKDIVQMVQDQAAKSDPGAMSSRSEFMIETLINLKNNKIKRSGSDAGSTAHAGSELLERMKKFLSGLSKKRHAHSPEPLRITLADLRSAETRGKWWLVGAAWNGDTLVDRRTKVTEVDGGTRAEANENDALVKLARKQGMNTEIRRAVFVVLMSSDDYVDACERLAALNLTEVQQREIMRVLLHCCGNRAAVRLMLDLIQEKLYNPYYTLVGQELCRTSHAYKITLQFCLWDFLRELGETRVGGMGIINGLKGNDSGFDADKVSTTKLKNVAKAYGWWIAKDCVHLGILKPVDFTVLKRHSRLFLKELLVQVFVGTQAASPLVGELTEPKTRNRSAMEEVFIKAARIEALAMGLVYFIGQEFRRESGERGGDLTTWAAGIAKDTLRTGLDVIPVL